MKAGLYKAIFYAIFAAALYAVSSPISKLLLQEIPPALMAALLYLGAGAGLSLVGLFRRGSRVEVKESKLTKKELPYTIGMVALDIAAPIFLMIGLTMTTPANASLLNNFEIVSTAAIALLVFHEPVGKRLWAAISLITLSSVILSIQDIGSFSFSPGSALVLLACVCWGLENNCTSKISIKDPLEIVIIKGFGSGTGSLVISLVLGERMGSVLYIVFALILGFFAYGLSIFFYIKAQRYLGAAKTSAYYSFAPFIGAGLSLLIFMELPTLSFTVALVIMIAGAYLASTEEHAREYNHTVITHDHSHRHDDGIHNHVHEEPVTGPHTHTHTHTDAHSHI
jgi:drug/metabolite transporter (DMT)-like permease